MKTGKVIFILLIVFSGIIISCSEDFLENSSGGNLDETLLANEKGIDALLIGAYSMLDGVSSEYGWESASSNWLYGSIRGMEANKGTDAGDSNMDISAIQTFSESTSNQWTMGYLNIKWKEVYESISRCNSAILVTKKALALGAIDQKKADLFLRQARALRGWFHFEAWRMWNKIPYVDESTDQTKLTNKVDIRNKIIGDLNEGITLPDNMGQIGRFNGTVVKVLLAKALMQMFQNYSEALPLLQSAKTGTKPDGSPIGLAPTYGEIFDIEKRNGIEAVYTVQYSVNDGSGGVNGGAGEVLNFPYKMGGSPAGCCGFFCPTQDFVNSFRTSGGLPLIDTYNSFPVKNDQGIPANTAKDSSTGLAYTDDGFIPDAGPLDPRLDWSVGRRGIAYWDWGLHTGTDWVRDQSYSGPYSPKKQVFKKSQEGKFTEIGSWTTGFTANGYRMIRFADVLLLIAECQIETNDLAGALVNINLIRARASNPAGFVTRLAIDGKPTTVPAANYVISQYTTLGTQDQARKILQMERKLELGQEGHRFFDLNRWKISVDELNRILTYEKTMQWGRYTYGNAIVGTEDVTYPIPQIQIDLSNGRLIQNR